MILSYKTEKLLTEWKREAFKDSCVRYVFVFNIKDDVLMMLPGFIIGKAGSIINTYRDAILESEHRLKDVRVEEVKMTEWRSYW